MVQSNMDIVVSVW